MRRWDWAVWCYDQACAGPLWRYESVPSGAVRWRQSSYSP